MSLRRFAGVRGVPILDGEVAGKTVHIVSVATMRGRRKKKAR
jgi:hypothetical protein